MYRVFIVDDEPFIIEGLYEAVDWPKKDLEIAGSAEDAETALSLLQKIPADILITDIAMPGMNGLDLISEIRKIKPELKVIILSGYDDFAFLKEAMRLGIENYLLKPINLYELEETLAGTVDKLNRSRSTYKLSEQDISILQSNILNRWLSGKIERNELQERIRFLGLKLDFPYVLVSVLRGNEQKLEETLRQLGGQHECVWHVVDNEGDFVVIFMMTDPVADKLRAVHLLQEIKRRCCDEEIIISLGSVEALPAGCSPSYRHAKEAQEYFMVLHQPVYVDYMDIQEQKEKAAMNLSLHWPDYAKLLSARDREALFRQVDYDFEKLRRSEGVIPSVLQSAAVELIVRFKMEMNDIQCSAAPDLVKSTLNGIMESVSIDQLIAVVKNGIGSLVDTLDNDIKSPIIQQILHHIHSSFAEDLSLKMLGAAYNIHPVYLGHLFHKEMGACFSEYINHYRIERAKELLRSTPLKVQDIARKVGYWEPGYFYKQFKKHAGMSPRDYKGLL